MDRLERREYNKAWYKANKETHIANVRKNNKRYRLEIRVFLDWLKEVPCTDCGRCWPPEAMDFDHLGDDKDFSVSHNLSASQEVMWSEIQKCEIVCACCHRVRTKNRSSHSSLG